MTFEETKNVIDEFLNSNQEILNKKEVDSLKESLKVIYEDIESLNKTGKFENNSMILKDMVNIIVRVSGKVLTAPLGNSFSDFILAFSELLFNWNNNTYHEEILVVLSKYMSNTIKTHSDMINVVKDVKTISDKLEVTRNWSPAAYDIAIAYVDEQLKINEEQKGVV